ncbi:netrin receptor unc-5 isoform X1 [Spodoptera frugiperda]|uniref:Netrin receptor unc-5 isoform X1 n=1 Tax=Spodoptera frugiperda TaxID=7108 RepID=A0A9R0ESP5_SPOFR|nr:netrin receptor unc-5 isoform X1 [Spodoptera frugiperda]
MVFKKTFWILFVNVMLLKSVMNGEPEHTTKETRPEYIHPDGLLNFDPYLSDFKTETEEEDDYIPLPENEETIDGLPIFLLEPKNSYVLRNRPANLLCRAANALEVYFKCNDVRSDKSVQLEHVDPHNGVRVVEAELNVTRNELDGANKKYSCKCYAWNSKGKIRSQAVLIEFAYIKKQFLQQPLSSTIEAGRGVTFRCVPPPAAPPPTIKWTRNGVAIEPTVETLVLPKVGLQDMANYTCVAENIAGRRESDVAVLSVYVNGGWSEWSPWAPCRCGSTTSGRRRSRSCTEPPPANGGAPCRGHSSQSDEDCVTCQSSGTWSAWASWSSCSVDCVRVRRRQCSGNNCQGSTLQHAACVDGLCTSGMRFYTNNTTLYVGIGITVAMLLAGVAILYVWCKYRGRPGYSAGRIGIPKTHSGRDKGSTAPDLTRTCNEYWMQGPDNHYDMPHVRDSYSSPFGNRSRHQSSAGSNHYEMKPYSPSGDSASSCYTNSRTMTSRSSECSSQLAELVTASPTSMSKVDVAVTLPTGHLDTSYRDKICLTIVK